MLYKHVDATLASFLNAHVSFWVLIKIVSFYTKLNLKARNLPKLSNLI